MANRLQPLLSRIISPQQAAFLPNRNISDNILLAQELCSDMNRKTRGGNVLLKLDMAKAYDRMSWLFLIKVLRKFGFGEQFIDWVWRLISNCWFSIMINGAPTGFFHSTRGLRQGDPLSPALFLIGAEILSRVLNDLPYTAAYALPRNCPQITHLSYADDVLIFTNGLRSSLTTVQEALKEYEKCSGQLVNVAKSGFYIGKASPTRRNLIEHITGFQYRQMPFTYLGCPIYWGKRRAEFFSEMVDKVAGKIWHWAKNLLSIGGRIALLKSVLSSIPLYTLAAANPPKGVLNKLERLFADFLWGSDEEGPKHHWISWSLLCRPLEEEGIGLRKLWDIYSSFSAKLWWNIMYGGTLWSSFMEAKYCSRERLETVMARSTDSLTWKRIIGIRSTVDDFIVRDGEQIYWTLSMDGQFSISSAHNLIRDGGASSIIGRNVWHKGIPIKISFFMLRLLKNRLPLDEVLRRFKIHGPSRCLCCSTPSEETLDHLFLHGQWAQRLWHLFGGPMGICGNPHRHRDMVILWWLKGGNPAIKVLLRVIPSLISWAIWKMRCSLKYDGANPCFTLITSEIIDTACFILQESLALKITCSNWQHVVSCAEGFIKPRMVTLVRWIKPPNGYLKLNTNEASRGNPGRGGGGGILGDHMGNSLLVFAVPYSFTTSVEAECQAMLKGLQLCSSMIGHTRVLVETDSKLLADILNNLSQTPWKLRKLIPSILDFPFVTQFQHCYRQANQAADYMANLGCELHQQETYSSQESLPREFRGILTLDKISFPSLRIKVR